MGSPLFEWPWKNMGALKYLLYGPFMAQVVKLWENGEGATAITSSWCFHILLLCTLKGSIYQLWTTYTNMYFLSTKCRIVRQGLDFQQVDQEWDRDNFLILQAFMGALASYIFLSLSSLTLWNTKGLITALILHVVFLEPLYYYLYRKLHGDLLFSRYHSLHHSSPVPQPFIDN